VAIQGSSHRPLDGHGATRLAMTVHYILRPA